MRSTVFKKPTSPTPSTHRHVGDEQKVGYLAPLSLDTNSIFSDRLDLQMADTGDATDGYQRT